MTDGANEEAVLTGEFALLASLSDLLDGDGPGVPVGVDDDAAVVTIGDTQVVVAVDTLVAAVHFDRALSSLEDVGWKALAVNVSDLAAMGAAPVAAVVSLTRPDGFDVDETRELYRGLRQAADHWGVKLVGGDTVAGEQLTVSVTLLGRLHGEPLRRNGAAPGDLVLLVGRIGMAAAGLAAWRAEATDVLEHHPDLLRAHRRPMALPEAGRALVHGGATAAIDVSDGLGRDAGHIAERSGVALRIDGALLPRETGVEAVAARLDRDIVGFVIGGGDDYALVATCTPGRLEAIQAAFERQPLRPRVIGEVIAGTGVTLVTEAGEQDIAAAGFEHVGGSA